MNNRNIKPISPFVTFCQKVIPLAFDESLSYYECLCALLKHLQEMDIAVNNNADAVTELQSYVENYFKNLDVQDEINNKLDDMAEKGELADIVAQYLELAGVLAFDDLAHLVGASNLANGSTARTLGLDNYLDGKGEYYKIRYIVNTDVVDGVNIISLTNYPTMIAEKIPNILATEVANINNSITDINGKIGDLNNLNTTDKDNLVASINEVNNKFIKNAFYTPEMFGAIGDSTTDDTTALQNAIDQSILDKKELVLKNIYKITDTLQINDSLLINGIGYEKSGIVGNIDNPLILINDSNVTLENIWLYNKGKCIVSDGVNTTVIMCNLNSEDEDCLTLCKANGLVDKSIFNPKTKCGVVITTSSTDSVALQINTRVLNSYFGYTGCGIRIDSVDSRRVEGISILGNNFITTGQYSILITNGLHINISDNIIDQAYTFGIYVNNTQNVDGLIVTNNYFAGGQTTAYHGIYKEGTSTGVLTNIVVNNNRSENTHIFAVLDQNCYQARFNNNILHGKAGGGDTGISCYKSGYCIMTNNTILNFTSAVVTSDDGVITKFIEKNNFYNGILNNMITTPSNLIVEDNIAI